MPERTIFILVSQGTIVLLSLALGALAAAARRRGGSWVLWLAWLPTTAVFLYLWLLYSRVVLPSGIIGLTPVFLPAVTLRLPLVAPTVELLARLELSPSALIGTAAIVLFTILSYYQGY